jgi:hypothetical protein
MAKEFASDYIDVATRINEAKAVYPELTLQAEIVAIDDNRVVMRAFAYRSADDPRPGIGHAWEVIPGRTPYTRGSELMVCETSAWGRALAALGIATRNGIASREEVEAAQSRQSAPIEAPRPANRPQTVTGDGLTVGQAMDALKMAGIERNAVSEAGKRIAGTWSLKEMTPQQRAAVVAELTGLVPVESEPVAGSSAADFDDVPF